VNEEVLAGKATVDTLDCVALGNQHHLHEKASELYKLEPGPQGTAKSCRFRSGIHSLTNVKRYQRMILCQ
jgi:hypothetical protein